MEINKSLFNGHENTRLVRYNENMPADFPNSIAFKDLSTTYNILSQYELGRDGEQRRKSCFRLLRVDVGRYTRSV